MVFYLDNDSILTENHRKINSGRFATGRPGLDLPQTLGGSRKKSREAGMGDGEKPESGRLSIGR
ncbi:MAG: hypothetical protein FWD31_05130 [Planctomycetaceae bacterium]|nr:hypothetical protein [Planctomycetaceae bacterium]